jgi:UDP-N-acetyl-D-mannosaminuronic acid dehydrogenase
VSSVCVHGLGYIGLPTAAMLANRGHDVFGYDADESVRAQLKDAETTFDEPGLGEYLRQAIDAGTLEIVDEVVPADYHVICVPTPFDADAKTADLSYVRAVGRSVAPVLREGDTVVLESTVPPGTTVEELQPLLEESGLDAGEEFALAHSPETVLPGDIIAELQANTRVVGGIDDSSVESAVDLYESFVDGNIRETRDPTVAEFVKLIQNTSRDVNIALANEIARLAYDYGIDSREAIELANDHPRVDILHPGPGVGGHCLPIDPWFLGADSGALDLISTARNVNDGMVEFVIELLEAELTAFDDAKVAVLGVAYKGNVSDTRMSPGLRLARTLGSQEQTPLAADGGAGVCREIALHDPHVTDPTLDLTDLESATEDADAIVLTTDHDEFEQLDPGQLRERMADTVVVDTKAILDSDEWRSAGFTVQRV